MEILQELETLIRARYPVIYVVTAEEVRVQAALRQIGEQLRKRVFEWTCTTGLVAAGTSTSLQKGRNLPTRDPIAALDEAVEFVEPAIFIFKDLHPSLSRENPNVVRRLKDVALQLKNSFKTIVLISPTLTIPPELDKEITVVNFPLPGAAELSALLDVLLEEVSSNESIRIDLDDEGRERLVQAALGLTLTEAENVFARLVVMKNRVSADDIGEVFAEKQQVVRKSGLLEYFPSQENLEGVGGLPLLKTWLAKRALSFSNDAREFGLPAPRGVLMIGVQGCGKSLCAKAVAGAWKLPLLRLDLGRVFGSFVGSSEENMRRAIQVAESVAPAVLWVDEIEKAFSGTQSSGVTDGGTTARVFGTFLTWLSEKESPVFVVSTANDISQLPPELLRKGRFDEIFFIDLPSVEERREIFRIHLGKRRRAHDQFDIAQLGTESEGFSGAEIEEAIVSALYDAFADRKELRTSHLRAAIRQTVPLSRTMDDQIARLRSWAAGRTRNASVPTA